MTFLLNFAVFTAALLLAAVPVIIVARRLDRGSTVRNFILAALGVGTAIAFVRVTSELAVEQCLDAGNSQCVDYGGSGLVTIFAAGYVVVALLRAWTLSR